MTRHRGSAIADAIPSASRPVPYCQAAACGQARATFVRILRKGAFALLRTVSASQSSCARAASGLTCSAPGTLSLTIGGRWSRSLLWFNAFEEAWMKFGTKRVLEVGPD